MSVGYIETPEQESKRLQEQNRQLLKENERLLKENKRLRFECGALIKEQITRNACDVARGIAAREPIEQHVALDAAIAEERKP